MQMSIPASEVAMLSSCQSHSLVAGLEAELLARRPASRFTVRKLHDRSHLSWAVIEQPDGTIAEDETGGLLMRLGKDEAIAIAQEMTGKARDAIGLRPAA